MSLNAADEAICAGITRQHARTFTAASRFLPADKRRAAFAVYAFCRVADDFVDEVQHGLADAERNLDVHGEQLQLALRGDARTPLFRELLWAIRRFDVPAQPFESLLEMLREDLVAVEYDNWAALERYCGGVASTVGEMCAHVFGLPTAPLLQQQALRSARTLGVALQLTNILRDVGEDAGRGRCYLPSDELAQFGIARDEVLRGSVEAGENRWRAFMQFQIARNRVLYQEAEPAIRMLDPDARRCALICSSGYAGILGAIERRNYDSLRGRARLGTGRKLLLVLQAWRETRIRDGAVHGGGRRATGDQALGTGG